LGNKENKSTSEIEQIKFDENNKFFTDISSGSRTTLSITNKGEI
jgi:hypothetical protein